MISLTRLFHSPEIEPVPLDVLGRADDIIPTLEFLVKSQGKPYSVVQAAMNYLRQFDDGLPPIKRNSLYVHRYGVDNRGAAVKNKRLNGSNIHSNSIDAEVDGCVLEGWGALSSSISPKVSGTLIIGDAAFYGDRDTFHHAPDFPLPESPRASFRSVEQYLSFVRAEQAIMSADPERILGALLDYSRTIPDEQYRKAMEYLGHDKDIIPMIIDNLHASLPDPMKSALETVRNNEKVVVAAHLIYLAIRNFHNGDTFQVSVDNSVVLGNNLFSFVKGGTIVNSIIAGEIILDDANVTVAKSYLISKEGTKFVDRQVFGQPEIYQAIPVSLTDQQILFDRMKPYREPAVQKFRELRGH